MPSLHHPACMIRRHCLRYSQIDADLQMHGAELQAATPNLSSIAGCSCVAQGGLAVKLANMTEIGHGQHLSHILFAFEC